MSTEIATLGLAVDSRAVVAATAALNSLTAAAAPAAQGAASLQAASARTATALQAQNSTMLTGSTGMLGQRMAIRGLAADLALLGPQFGTVAGMAGTLYLSNEAIFRGFGNVRNAMTALLTPSNLLIGGFAAAAVGALTLYESIKTTELEFGALAERTNTTVQALHGFESAAAFKGISTADFLKGMEKFGDLSNDATHNLGSMAQLFTANGVAAGSLDSSLMHVADLVANARSEADKYRIIQQAGLPATREWVGLLGQGSANLKQAALDAVQFGGAADEQMIAKARQFDEAWATTWRNWTSAGKSAFLQIEAGFTNLGDLISRVSMKLHPDSLALRIPDAFSQLSGFQSNTLQSGLNAAAARLRGGGGNTVDPEAEKLAIQNAIPRTGPLGQLPTAKEAREKDDDKTEEKKAA